MANVAWSAQTDSEFETKVTAKSGNGVIVFSFACNHLFVVIHLMNLRIE